MIQTPLKRILERIFPSNKLFIKQVGYFFYLQRSITYLFLRLFNGEVNFLPSYINPKNRQKYICHDWDPSGSEVFITDGYVDWGLEILFMHSVKPGGCLVDVGAHSGYFSHLLYDKFSHFINIETSEICMTRCLLKTEVKWKDKVVHNVNLPAFEKDNIEVSIKQNSQGFGESKYLGHGKKDKVISESLMRTITIDTLYSRLEKSIKFDGVSINGIKIDVDGCDSEVLRGAIKSIKRFNPVIYMESFSSDDFEFLKEFDYKIYTMVSKKSDPRSMKFINIPSADFLSKVWYKMCIAVPSSNDCLSLFNGMRRDNHDRKKLFVDI